MKMLRLLTLFLIFTLPSHAQDFAFKSGEKISYTVFYNVIGLYVNAGTATFSASRVNFQNNDAYHVVGEGVTNSKYDWIFKVRDRYESYFHADNLKPLKFIRNVNEGDYKKYEEVVFDHDKKIAISKKGMIRIPHQVQDVISTLYYARNIDYNNYKPGDKIPFNMFLDDEVYNLYIRYMGKESVKTKYGTFKAIKIKPLLLKGQTFNGGEKMTIWVTDDANHIPVRIESPIVVGSVKVDLMEYQNLKYPLTALTRKK